MADAMMMFLGEAHGVNWYWAQPGEFENPGVYYWDGAKNVLCVPHLAAAPEAPAQAVVQVPSGTKVVDRGFRWDGEGQQHFPRLVVEFEPVPVNGGSNAKGWADRDALDAMLAAAPEAPAQRCPNCDDTGDVHDQIGEWRGRCDCPAGQEAPDHPIPPQWREAMKVAREALKEIADDYADRFDLDSPSTNPGIKSSIKQARAALAQLDALGGGQPVQSTQSAWSAWERSRNTNTNT